ncbi:TPA: hypothetical protein QDB01_000398 [Burkholderia vietnamiensis]|nr:hypothetical protein [Burkholderia vietnamiensis]
MTTLRYSDTARYPTLNGPKCIEEIRALRALGRDVLKTPLHWIALNLATDAYQALVTDRRTIGILGTGERIAIGDLILSVKPEHTKPRADLILLTADRLGLPPALLALVVARVLAAKDARADGSLTRYRAVMKARALDDVQFVFNEDEQDGHGEVQVYSRKARIAENDDELARAKAPMKPAAVLVRPAAPAPSIASRLLGMFGR